MKKLTAFFAVLLFAVAASAATTYTILVTAPVKAITGAQAANIADEFIAVGAWTGTRVEMHRCVVARDDSASTGFSAFCVGQDDVAAAAVPVGATILDAQ